MGWLLQREVLAYSMKDWKTRSREEDLMEYSMESKQLLELKMVVGEKKKKGRREIEEGQKRGI